MLWSTLGADIRASLGRRRRKPLASARSCAHGSATPVELLEGGDVVAYLCEACGEQLPGDWVTPDRAAYGRVRRPVAPSSREELADLLSDQKRIGAYFSREAVADGTTKEFLENYARQAARAAPAPVPDHATDTCPKRLDVTTMSDSRPRYIHGCDRPETHASKLFLNERLID
jgi:hypothetical protein